MKMMSDPANGCEYDVLSISIEDEVLSPLVAQALAETREADISDMVNEAWEDDRRCESRR